MLYNEKQKQAYFEATNLNEPLQAYFTKTAPYEDKLEKDLCQWNVNEIINFYKSLCSPSNYYITSLNSQYKGYAHWCIAENLVNDGMNHFSEIDRDIINNCLNNVLLEQKIVTREELISSFRVFENDVDKYICLALFEGIGGKDLEDLIGLRLSDFNTTTGTITLGDKKVKFSKELYNYAVAAASQTYYYQSEDRRQKYELIGDPDLIIKKKNSHGNQDDVVRKRNIIQKMVRFRQLYGKAYFSSKALNESGRIYYVKKLIAEGKYTNVLDALNDKYIVDTYGLLNSRPAYIDRYNL